MRRLDHSDSVNTPCWSLCSGQSWARWNISATRSPSPCSGAWCTGQSGTHTPSTRSAASLTQKQNSFRKKVQTFSCPTYPHVTQPFYSNMHNLRHETDNVLFRLTSGPGAMWRWWPALTVSTCPWWSRSVDDECYDKSCVGSTLIICQVYHPFRQPDFPNLCLPFNGHCSHLCLPSPGNKHTFSEDIVN